MRIRRKRVVAAAAVLALLGLPSLAGAAPFDSETVYEPISFMRFCSDSQNLIANIDPAQLSAQGITVSGKYYSDLDNFITSKSAVVTTPPRQIVTTQHVTYRDAERTKPDQIRCKYRTGESLAEGDWPAGEPNNREGFEVEPAFGFGPTIGGALSTDPANDRPCSDINQRTIDAVWGSLTPEDQAASPYKPAAAGGTTLVTEPDVSADSGPAWTDPFPTLKLVGNTLVVPSKSLYSPTTVVSPNAELSSRFGGGNYCTLVAPEYLRDVLLGTASVS